MIFSVGVVLLAGLPGQQALGTAAGRYEPVPGGWRLQLSDDGAPGGAEGIGAVKDDARAHRRPLFPPADKRLVWTEEECKALERSAFRPLVLAYNAPRFLFDFHSAGGLLGHLFVGIVERESGVSAWLHEWREIDVSYVSGMMRYALSDARFPGARVTLEAAPLAEAAGLILKVKAEGDLEGHDLVWMYGGASAFLTNYNMTAPEFTFAPEHCAKDSYDWLGNRFMLRRAFDDTDVYKKEVYAAARYLPDWEAVLMGGSSWAAEKGFGDPKAVLESPAALSDTASWTAETPGGRPASQQNCVAVERLALSGTAAEGFVVLGMGRNIAGVVANPTGTWDAAMRRNEEIAHRIVVETPDPYLNSAVTMMAFATEGTWGDLAILHGGWSWRYAYLGWRGWYGSDCYGWTERVKQSIERHTAQGVVREGPDAGALGSLLEYAPGVFYNMNEVFLDHVRHYFDYTNDLELMRALFPVLKGILAWEDRRLQPEGQGLYENSLNTWISDSHWYIGGQCTQASAYMLNANRFVADLAARLGENPESFLMQAENIYHALQSQLWLPHEGVFAEYRDTRGYRLLHPEPELPTLYHSAEFGAASPLQIARMLQWGDAHLRHETTLGGGRLVWSSNWYPNRGRSYTHSTYEMAYGEELNYALTNYLAGRAEEGHALLRATLCGIYNGPTPGGLACHSNTDGTQRANDEFADAISMWGRAVMEGLFGIQPHRPNGEVVLCPQPPKDWAKVSVAGPHLSYSLERQAQTTAIHWTSPVETRVRLLLPIPGSAVRRAQVDGVDAAAAIEPGHFGMNWAVLESRAAKEGAFLIEYGDQPPPVLPALDTTKQRAERLWRSPVQARDPSLWTLVDLSPVFNAAVTGALQQVTEKAVAPDAAMSQVGFGYWKDHLLQYHGSRNEAISDAAWRGKIEGDGIGWTTEHIPFKSPKEGPNIAVVTRAGGFPAAVEVPVRAKGRKLLLMLSGITFPAQSHVVNLRVTLHYADGVQTYRDLVNPIDIGDCWSTWCGRFHDTAANGFENIGGRSGPAGSAEVQDLTQPVAVDTEAHLVSMDLRGDAELESFSLEAVANDVIFGLMGASVLK